MRLTPRRLALWIVLVACTSAPLVHAAEGSSRREALRIADEGAAAYKAGNFAEALQKFDKAYNLYPAPPLLLNLSRTELKLGQCDAAIRYAEIYSADTETGAASHKSRTSWLEHVKSECVEVEVASTPPGVSLTIEGVPTASPATTPWHGRLLIGKYALTANAPGYDNHAETLVVEAGKPLQITLQLTPEPAPPLPPEPARLVAPESAAPPAASPPAAGVPSSRAIDLTPPSPSPSQPPVEAAVHKGQPRPKGIVRDVGWAGIAVGGAALVSAVALGVSSQGQKALLTSATARTSTQADSEWAKEKSYATATNALSVVGGVIAAAGVVVVIVF